LKEKIIYFKHIFLVFARLGLFEDSVPLTHANRQKVTNREWRTSFMDSFASNLAFVLFQCKGDQYRVGAYVQERPVNLPGCSQKLCHFSEFSAKYGQLADSCNLDNICRI
jgi:multiple inositol-polyphosphate phosphatase/2,3-bisphosphoglycerate 3-phosphatase